MFHHATTHHDGIIGPGKGNQDYKFQVTGHFRDNLTRQTNEGVRQTDMEKYQAENKITVLNSKIDFCQPMRTNLAVISKSNNIKPGIIDIQTETTEKKAVCQEQTDINKCTKMKTVDENSLTDRCTDVEVRKDRKSLTKTPEKSEIIFTPSEASTPIKKTLTHTGQINNINNSCTINLQTNRDRKTFDEPD